MYDIFFVNLYEKSVLSILQNDFYDLKRRHEKTQSSQYGQKCPKLAAFMNSTELQKIKTSQEGKYFLARRATAHSCGCFMLLVSYKPIGSILLVTKKRLVN